MSIKLETTPINRVYHENSKINRIYDGTNIVFGTSVVITPPTPPELYLTTNALARENEDGSLTGITNTTSTDTAVQTPTPQLGSWMVEISGTVNGRINVSFEVVSGKVYEVKYFAWAASGGGGTTRTWAGFVTSPNQSWTETPTEYTHQVTANITGTSTLRWYLDAGVVYVDGLSIKEVL